MIIWDDPDLQSAYIYVLSAPHDPTVRYVGQTRNPDQRYRAHCHPLPTNHTACADWIRGLREREVLPVMRIIDRVPVHQINESERRWIKSFEDQGCNLLNHLLCDKQPFIKTAKKQNFCHTCTIMNHDTPGEGCLCDLCEHNPVGFNEQVERLFAALHAHEEERTISDIFG